VMLKSAGETASLRKISISLSQSLSKCMTWAFWWMGSDIDPVADNQDINVVLNTDFISNMMGTDTIRELVAAYSARVLSKQQLFKRFQEGEIIDQDVTFEDEEALIKGDTTLQEMFGGGMVPDVDPDDGA